jgi:hypothetical protein
MSLIRGIHRFGQGEAEGEDCLKTLSLPEPCTVKAGRRKKT